MPTNILEGGNDNAKEITKQREKEKENKERKEIEILNEMKKGRYGRKNGGNAMRRMKPRDPFYNMGKRGEKMR